MYRGIVQGGGVIRGEPQWGERWHKYFGFPVTWKHDFSEFFYFKKGEENGSIGFYWKALGVDLTFALGLSMVVGLFSEVAARKKILKENRQRFFQVGSLGFCFIFGGIIPALFLQQIWRRSHSMPPRPGSIEHRRQFHREQIEFLQKWRQHSNARLSVDDVKRIGFFREIVGGPSGFATFACPKPYCLAAEEGMVIVVIFHDYPCWGPQQGNGPMADWDRPFFDRHPEYLSPRYGCFFENGFYVFKADVVIWTHQ